ncbi:MAG: hypothetical protein ACREEM_06770 [Blastocatellia bacterium]
MFRKSLSLALISLLIYPMGNSAAVPANPQTGQQTQAAGKVKAEVLKRNPGRQSRVSVKRHDKTTLTGYITRAGEDSFDLTDAKTGEVMTLAYSEVAQVKGRGLSGTTKLIIGMGVLMGLMMGGMAAFGDMHH